MKSQTIKKAVSLVLCLLLFVCALVVNVYADTIVIDHWNSNMNRIYKWNSLPSTIYIYRFEGMPSSYVSGIQYGVTNWKNQLGIAMGTITTTVSGAPSTGYAKFFGGSLSQLQNLSYWNYDETDTYGLAGYVSHQATRNYNVLYTYIQGVPPFESVTNVYRYDIAYAIGFIINLEQQELSYNQNSYNFVGTHEIGHVLGWCGHSSNPNAVMYDKAPETNISCSLYTSDVEHISQFYN